MFTYVTSDREDIKNVDEIYDKNYNEDKNIHPPPDREMEQRPTGVKDHAELQQNAGLHHNEMHKSGVYT